ncbi:MAG: (E)-4-hydroxy-3-methylbut-2-enyl-diphosphate synthase [Candidatus Marinimicrobia bacterium]|nr:(E)-4-hydroxy-3-methylbut-2-enyl-diphosphate synthase [Candidatus Neomarinimicrobiota bacterium]
MSESIKYCESLTQYQRLKTRVVHIGDIPLGGEYPIRVQSMTTTDSMDTQATVEQSIRMIEAGCEYVRITAPSIREARNLAEIKKELRKQGYNTPLIADIHFTPNAALEAARIVEKVRINPGNFADRKKFQDIEYTDQSYDEELERIHDRFSPLVKVCKEEGCALRIGSNHGSLSDRILSRYGDTPLGMVESAMEFLRICQSYNYHEIILSMKSSNTRVMVQAYRLLVNKMSAEGLNYPLHLGVTEAGDGEDGRIKSAVGIGTLLEDGLGDTVRVSLTEEPEYEIPVAKALVDRYTHRNGHEKIAVNSDFELSHFEYQPHKTNSVLNIGGDNVPRVLVDLALEPEVNPSTLSQLGYKYFEVEDKWGIGDFACDYIFINKMKINFDLPGTLGVVQVYSVWKDEKLPQHYPQINVSEYLENDSFHSHLNFIYLTLSDLSEDLIKKLKCDQTAVLLIDTYNEHGMSEQREIFRELLAKSCSTPVIIGRYYCDLSVTNMRLYSATDMGALLIEGLGDGVFIAAEKCGTLKEVNQTAFGILQASRTRISKTEYISCPSCGRTLFDLQETTALVRERTSHLKGVKIGIMGCIVNGPGEMADADYGYVGTGVGKISLYRGQNVVQSNLPMENAVDVLIDLMKEDGVWVEVQELDAVF